MSYDRKIFAVGKKKEVMEGAGEIVGRVLPQGRIGLEPVDPFLMLDHFKMTPGGPGFPEHPHRGFEILTYIRSGWAQHKDNFGNEATIQAGGMMRLTAGKGMWHGEAGGAKSGEVIEGLQFWVNLERAKKGIDPAFQSAEDKEFPRQTQDNGNTVVKVLVGPGSPVQIITPMFYLEVTVKPGGKFLWDIPSEHQGFVYLLEGQAEFEADGAQAATDQVAILGAGSGLALKNSGSADLVFVMAAGKPHREPVFWNGPYVD